MKFPELKNYFLLNKKDEIINFQEQGIDGNRPLFFVLNANQNFLFSKEKILFLINNSDLNTLDGYSDNFLNLIVQYNWDKKLYFTKKEILNFIPLIDVNHRNDYNLNFISNVFLNNVEQKLNFTEKQLFKLASLYDFNEENVRYDDTLFSISLDKSKQDKNITFSLLNYIYEQTSFDENFKKFLGQDLNNFLFKRTAFLEKKILNSNIFSEQKLQKNILKI